MGALAVSFRGRLDRWAAGAPDEAQRELKRSVSTRKASRSRVHSGHAGVQAGGSELEAFPHYQLGWSRRAKPSMVIRAIAGWV
jgi:hypothetical protein